MNMDIVLIAAIVLGVIGLLSALVLFIVARRFSVVEDGRVVAVEELLPGANCGACGYSGCHAFAAECVSRGGVDSLLCPGAGQEGMAKIAAIMGGGIQSVVPKVAVLRCAGECARRHKVAVYEGPRSCSVVNRAGAGELSCAFGCLGCGDCVAACTFGALSIDVSTGMPHIDAGKCTGCGMCSLVCPRNLIEIRPAGPRGRLVWVACSNPEKGAVARRGCEAACIGCGKCVKACPFGAVTLNGALACIDADKCRLCRKCVAQCPTGAILTAGFPEVSGENVVNPVKY